MPRIIQKILLMTLMLGIGLVVQAQPTAFKVWIYAPETGVMIESNESTELWRGALPLPPTYDLAPFSIVAVSPDGDLFGYTAGRSGSFEQALVIYSRSADSILATYAPPSIAYGSLDLSGRGSFSPDGNLFAFGYSLEDEGWELLVIDTVGFSLVGQLRSVDRPELPGGFALTPVPARFHSADMLGFTLVQSGTEGQPRYEAFLWEFSTGNLSATNGYSSLDMDTYSPTGEVVFAQPDERLPFAPDDRFTFGQNNAVFWFDPDLRTSTPFIHDANRTFFNPRFAASGQFIVVGAFDGTNTTYLVYDRTGALIADYPIPDVVNVLGTARGFVFLGRFRSAPAVFHIDLLSGGAIPAGPVWADGGVGFPFLAAVSGAQPYFTDLGIYSSWGSIAPAIADSGLSVGGGTVGTPPTESGTLRIGGQATVRTTEGDSLNMRSGAGTAFIVVTRVSPGSVVTLLEGPVNADSFTWWRVRLSTGQEGWVVDFADGESTLLPGEVFVDTTPPTAVPVVADPSVGSQLGVGDVATVLLGRASDTLRLRTEPVSGRIIELMPSYTIVDVIGGPVNAGGYIWWQLRTRDNNVGYAAEIIGSERVLVRGALVAPLVLTPVLGAPPVIVPVTTPEVRAP